jgi:subtilase family serine protease
MVPDVSANAGIPYNIYVRNGWVKVGGTSAVAPLYAGLFASFGENLGFVAPALWANQLCFNDITAGDNGFYRAKIGPDACTGLGSPIGTKLASLFVKPGSPLLDAVAADPGWSGTITHTFLNGVRVKTTKTS